MNLSSISKRVFTTAAVVMLAVGLSTPAFAAYMVSQENLVINEDIQDDAYMSAGYGNIQANIDGDLYIAGGMVNINGNIDEDLVVAGGMVRINGDIGGDLRVLGGQVSVNGNVGDDLMVASGIVDVSKDATVMGEVAASTGVLTIDGSVKDGVTGVMGILVINGTVGGDVNVTVEDSVSMGPDARVGGNLHYSALFEAEIPEEVVAGEVAFKQFEKEGLYEEDLNYLLYTQTLYSFLATVLLSFIFVALAPNALINAAKMAKENTFKAFGIGLLTVIGLAVGSIVLFLTIIGIPLAVMGFAAILIIFYTGRVFAAVWMANMAFKFNKKTKRPKLFGFMLLAVLAYYFVGLIPYLGIVIDAILFLIGVGALVMMKVDYMKHLKAKKLL